MKFVTCSYKGKELAGILSNNGKDFYPLSAFGCAEESLNAFIRRDGMHRFSDWEEQLASKTADVVPLNQIKLLAPIPEPAQDILCLGVNFMAHAEESARFKKEAFANDRKDTVYFSKRVNRAVADGDSIDGHFDIVDSLDYEAELAVIIGKNAFQVSEADAFSYVFGYTILNDVSARNLQTRHKQWYFGKSLDGFCPMGPWIVTADAFEKPPRLAIRSRINGELRQDSTTALFITGIARAISELSQGITLKAGTILAMGTPAVVGMGFTPPKFLKSGDIVECEIEGIGKLTNPVK